MYEAPSITPVGTLGDLTKDSSSDAPSKTMSMLSLSSLS